MKQYSTPATQEQSMTMCQLMAGSPNGMGVNDDPLNGGGAGEIIYGG